MLVKIMKATIIILAFLLGFVATEYYKLYLENKHLRFQLKEYQIIDSLYNERIQQIYPDRLLNESIYDVDTVNS